MDDFIKSDFAQNGAKTPIPFDTDPDGFVSFDQGYGLDYTRKIGVDPLAKPVEREGQNWLFGFITRILRRWQTRGLPDFITAADNGGSPFPYSLGACIVWTDGHPYRSKIANNLTDPTNTTNWEKIGSVTWQNIPGKPAVVAEGETKQAARESIGVVDASESSNGLARYASVAQTKSAAPNLAMTPANFRTLFVGKTFDVTTSRTQGVEYENTYGWPMYVQLIGRQFESGHLWLYVDGVQVSGVNIGRTGRYSACAWVMPGEKYSYQASSGAQIIREWRIGQ